MDEPADIMCNDCDARFCVIWHNWPLAKPIEFCPFCGSEDLELPAPQEESDDE